MMKPQVSDNNRRAVDVHSAQAQLFADRYSPAQADPYRDCFAYSRHRLCSYLDGYLPPVSTTPRLLDVGCGTGHWMRFFAHRGYDVSGVDASERMLETARRINPRVRIECADVEALPFESASFDFVLSIEVLRYLRDPQAVIHEVARVLKPGGVALVTAAPVLNLNGYWLVNQITSRAQIGDLTHLRQYFTTSRGLRKRFRREGFSDVRAHGVYFGPLNWIERLVSPCLRGALRRWEPIDRRIADRPLVRDFSNMYLLRAVRGNP